MRFFLLIPQFVGLLLSYTTLHHITKTISTLFRDISETFPSQCRSHVVRMSFASRLHLVRIMECNDNVRLLIL